MAQRIGRYARLIGRENVIAGSDCGYGTRVGQAAVDPDVVWASSLRLPKACGSRPGNFGGDREHDPGKVETGFRKRSCSNNKQERGDEVIPL